MRSVGCLVSPAKSGVNVPGVGIGQLPPASTWLRIFWKEGGQTVKMETADAISYVASIVPGTVLTVKAFKQYDGPHVLTTVPTDYYTVSNVTYGSIQAVMITMERELSTYRYDDGTNQGWGNEIYVTFQSSVGPNTVDIMAYLIDTYTDLTWDNDSFNYCWQKLQKFPSNFALLEVKNVIDVLRDIAFQCRCALWISDNVFYMKYLPEEPTLPNFTLAGVSPTDPTTWHNDPNWSAVPANVTAAPGQSVLVNATETSEEVLTGWTKNIFGQEEPVYTNEPSYSVGVSTPQNQVVDVIHVSDIDSETGVEVAYTSTENIVTKMKVTWRHESGPGQSVSVRCREARAADDPAAQSGDVRPARKDVQLVHLQPARHHFEVRDLLDDSLLDDLEDAQVPHLPQQVELGDLGCGLVRRWKQELRHVGTDHGRREEGAVQLGRRLHRV